MLDLRLDMLRHGAISGIVKAIDETHAKRGAIVLALAVLGIGATIIFAWPSFLPQERKLRDFRPKDLGETNADRRRCRHFCLVQSPR